MINIVRTPFSFCSKFLFRLITPLIRNMVEKIKATVRITVWITQDFMKQMAVTGRKVVRLYPYMQIN